MDILAIETRVSKVFVEEIKFVSSMICYSMLCFKYFTRVFWRVSRIFAYIVKEIKFVSSIICCYIPYFGNFCNSHLANE